MNELVSVIIPYYKKKKFILESLNSILFQKYNNLEILIIYDDENMSDLEFIRKITAQDPRIRIIINNKNLGAGLSRNIGIQESKGYYLSFIDSDDIWHKDKIKNQIDFMKQNNFSFSHTSYSIIDEKKNFLEKREARNFYKVDDLIKSCDIGLSTVMIKKSIFGSKIFPNLKTKEDFVLWLNFLKEGHTINGLSKDLTYWRKTSDSLSSNSIQKLYDGFLVYNKFMKFNFFKSLYYLILLSFNYLRK